MLNWTEPYTYILYGWSLDNWTFDIVGCIIITWMAWNMDIVDSMTVNLQQTIVHPRLHHQLSNLLNCYLASYAPLAACLPVSNCKPCTASFIHTYDDYIVHIIGINGAVWIYLAPHGLLRRLKLLTGVSGTSWTTAHNTVGRIILPLYILID